METHSGYCKICGQFDIVNRDTDICLTCQTAMFEDEDYEQMKINEYIENYDKDEKEVRIR